MKARIFQNISLVCISLVIWVLIFECLAAFLIRPAPKSYGVFLKRELPPFKIKILDNPNEGDDQPIKGMVVNSQKITWGDLRGIAREDEILGYAPMENKGSLHGWWQSNNVGANSRENVPTNIPLGKHRVIIFGESFASGWGVPLEESWPFFMNKKSKEWEFINFGVGGYSMGQCLLRFEIIQQKIDYDIALLVFVPSVDLWRDVNVLRQLRGWAKGPIMPRFVVVHDQLRLVQSPYKTWRDAARDNADGISEILKRHLRAYDRFYVPSRYESPPWIGTFISYKLLASVAYDLQNKRLLQNMARSGSEARVVSQRIIERMADDVRQGGRKFVVVYMPTMDDVKQYKNSRSFAQQYDDMVTSTVRPDIVVIDLMKDFIKVAPFPIDLSYDGSHYGPKVNKLIAELVWRYLQDRH